MNTKTFTYYNEDGDEEEEVELPIRMEVCSECEGYGTVLCEGMRHYGYSSEEFEREFDDEEREQYFKRGGIYDVQCPECNGRNVVPVVDEDGLSTAQRAVYDQIQEQWAEQAAADAADARTRRMESGGYDCVYSNGEYNRFRILFGSLERRALSMSIISFAVALSNPVS